MNMTPLFSLPALEEDENPLPFVEASRHPHPQFAPCGRTPDGITSGTYPHVVGIASQKGLPPAVGFIKRPPARFATFAAADLIVVVPKSITTRRRRYSRETKEAEDPPPFAKWWSHKKFWWVV
jgi:hypothetical protein